MAILLFTENQNICVCLICHETVVLFKEHNVNIHYETKCANAYNKLSKSERSEKVRQVQYSLAVQQRFFMSAHEPNENISKASYKVAMLIVKHGSPFTEVYKDCYENSKKQCVLATNLSEHTFSVLNLNKNHLGDFKYVNCFQTRYVLHTESITLHIIGYHYQ